MKVKGNAKKKPLSLDDAAEKLADIIDEHLADLPDDQQSIAREVIASVPGMTEESYLATYNP